MNLIGVSVVVVLVIAMAWHATPTSMASPTLVLPIALAFCTMWGYMLGASRPRVSSQSTASPHATISTAPALAARLHAALELLRDLLPCHVVDQLLHADTQRQHQQHQHCPQEQEEAGETWGQQQAGAAECHGDLAVEDMPCPHALSRFSRVNSCSSGSGRTCRCDLQAHSLDNAFPTLPFVDWPLPMPATTNDHDCRSDDGSNVGGGGGGGGGDGSRGSGIGGGGSGIGGDGSTCLIRSYASSPVDSAIVDEGEPLVAAAVVRAADGGPLAAPLPLVLLAPVHGASRQLASPLPHLAAATALSPEPFLPLTLLCCDPWVASHPALLAASLPSAATTTTTNAAISAEAACSSGGSEEGACSSPGDGCNGGSGGGGGPSGGDSGGPSGGDDGGGGPRGGFGGSGGSPSLDEVMSSLPQVRISATSSRPYLAGVASTAEAHDNGHADADADVNDRADSDADDADADKTAAEVKGLAPAGVVTAAAAAAAAAVAAAAAAAAADASHTTTSDVVVCSSGLSSFISRAIMGAVSSASPRCSWRRQMSAGPALMPAASPSERHLPPAAASISACASIAGGLDTIAAAAAAVPGALDADAFPLLTSARADGSADCGARAARPPRTPLPRVRTMPVRRLMDSEGPGDGTATDSAVTTPGADPWVPPATLSAAAAATDRSVQRTLILGGIPQRPESPSWASSVSALTAAGSAAAVAAAAAAAAAAAGMVGCLRSSPRGGGGGGSGSQLQRGRSSTWPPTHGYASTAAPTAGNCSALPPRCALRHCSSSCGNSGGIASGSGSGTGSGSGSGSGNASGSGSGGQGGREVELEAEGGQGSGGGGSGGGGKAGGGVGGLCHAGTAAPGPPGSPAAWSRGRTGPSSGSPTSVAAAAAALTVAAASVTSGGSAYGAGGIGGWWYGGDTTPRRLHRASAGCPVSPGLGGGGGGGGVASPWAAARLSDPYRDGSPCTPCTPGGGGGRSGSSSGNGGGGGGGGTTLLGRDLPYAEWHPSVSVLFADIVGFTTISNKVPAVAVMEMLNALYCRLDALCSAWGHTPATQQQQQQQQTAPGSPSPWGGGGGPSPFAPGPSAGPSSLYSPSSASMPGSVYKVQIIGDAYMVATGLLADDPAHAATACAFALAVLREAEQLLDPVDGRPLRLRIGIHSGPVVSGVVGRLRRQYSVFGDTVNVASRMESTGAPGAIHVSEDTQRLAAPFMPPGACGWEQREGVEVKGKGTMDTYWLLPPQPQPTLLPQGPKQRDPR